MTEGAAPTFIGIDLGGTQLRAALVGSAGETIAVRRIATDRAGPEAVIEQIDALVSQLRQPDTAGIGIGVPCALDGSAGIVPDIPALPGWIDVPLAAELMRRSALPTLIENDAKVATIAEWTLGAGLGAPNFVFVTISTGIGGGAVMDGRLLHGFGGLAGEVGHMKIADQTPRCSCGRLGCWQAVASGTALELRAADAIAAEPGSVLAQRAAGGSPTGQQIHVTALEGCVTARRLLRELAEYLGWGLANIQHCYSPELIVIGGGVAQALDLMLDDIEASMRSRLLPSFPLARIVRAKLGDDAGILGAAILAEQAWRAQQVR